MSPIALHVLLQILDGILTYVGVLYLGFGTEIEGNPIVRWLMNEMGPSTALVVTKGTGILSVLGAALKMSDKGMLQTVISRVNLLYMLACAMWAYAFLR
jgi:uncharacterized membrane protein